MLGGTVCRTHGGAAPQVRYAAYVAHFKARVWRRYAAESARWGREWTAWQVERVITTADLLGIPATNVNEALIEWCRLEHGRPDPYDAAPRMRPDRRYTAPEPPHSTRRARP
jgi:hypothetical protein